MSGFLTAGEQAALNEAQEWENQSTSPADDVDSDDAELMETVVLMAARQGFSSIEIGSHLDTIQAQRDQLEADFESGDSDLTWIEHRAKLRELDNAARSLSDAKAEQRILERLAADSAEKQWVREVSRFKAEARRDGIDYDRDTTKAEEWNRAVKFLGQDPENAGQDGRWFLEEAHRMVQARGSSSGYGAPNLDNLSGPELEKAVARMTPEEQERYAYG